MSITESLQYVRNNAKDLDIDISDKDDEDLIIFALNFLGTSLEDAFGELDLDDTD